MTGPRRRSTSLPDLLRRAAESSPARTALVHDGGALSYAALDARVDAVCQRLRTAGVRPGQRVGLAVRSGGLPLVAAAAVMRAGAAYLPLDVRHPEARLRFLVEDAGLERVVGDAAGAAALAHVPVEVVPVGDADLAAPAEPGVVAADPHGASGPEVLGHAAYVMYTSGSTGRPKGVEVTHANVLSMLRDALPLFRYGADEVWPLQHAYGFDVSVWEMWAGIATGATLVAVSESQAGDPELLAESLLRHRATRLHIVPSVFRHLAEVVAEERLCVPLRSVVFCGEAVSYDAIQVWNAAHQPRHRPDWRNVYGITETTVYNTLAVLTPAEIERSDVAAPIGAGYPNSPVIVLDDQLRSTEPDDVGEIYVGGRQVAAGYVGNPALTAERFCALPGRPGRWYRTGDLGAVASDGTLRCLGRRDEQVKIRGHRIELGEVDHALRAVPWLRDGAAVVGSSSRGEAILTAYVVPASTAEGDGPQLLDRLRAELVGRLPAHMLPSRVERVDQLPRNANGKTDRRALGAGPAR